MSIYKKYGIYEIRNLATGKVYIGQTTANFGDRWDCHKAMLRGGYHYSKELQSDWNKYEEDSFDFVILRDCTGMSADEVDDAEKEEIARAKQSGNAYNLHDGGHDGYFKGKHLSDEAKKKIGEKNRVNMTGRKAPDETRLKMSESQRARYSNWTDEDRKAWGAKMSETHRGRKKPKLSTAMKGNKRGSKYTVDQILEIKRLFNVEHKSNREIAEIMSMKVGTVGGITSGRRWADVG